MKHHYKSTGNKILGCHLTNNRSIRSLASSEKYSGNLISRAIILWKISHSLASLKGEVPESIWYKVQPSAQRSLLLNNKWYIPVRNIQKQNEENKQALHQYSILISAF